MIVNRSMHPDYRSNTWLLADEPGGSAVFIDAGAPVEPLMAQVEDQDLTVCFVLLTHEHHDHTTHAIPLAERYDAPVVTPEVALADDATIACGALTLRPLSTPGHCTPHVAWLAERDGEPVGVFTGDALFAGTVGGTLNGGPDGFQQLRHSILDVLLSLQGDTPLWPGHMEATTVAEELAHNPFVRAWRGDDPAGNEQVQVAGNDATLLLEAGDYDGGTKAWVRFADGREAIVGGSMVSRAGVRA
jgi:glyoxylase-like metal-dependent hydrolase (beta-lactamase superfamily II)